MVSFARMGRGGLHHLTVQRVSEHKSTKNRSHLDLFVDDADNEVQRLVRLGASVLAHHEGYYVTTVMGDPENNEFCVVQRPKPGAQ